MIGLSGGGAPRILSGFGDWSGPEDYPRVDGLHRGVDVAGSIGSPVLSAADGRVTVARDNRDACGRPYDLLPFVRAVGNAFWFAFEHAATRTP